MNRKSANVASDQSTPANVELPRSYVAIGTVLHLELMGRVRSKKWVIAIIAWIILLVLVWMGSLALSGYFLGNVSSFEMRNAWRSDTFAWMLLFTLLVVLIVSPALSSTAINAERQTSNLAIIQATPITATHLLWGKILAGWVMGAVFVLAAAIPLGIIAAVTGMSGVLVVKSLAVILVEVFVVCALGVGFSSLIVRPAISVLITYLTVGALTVGGPLLFAFTINPMTDVVEYQARTLDYAGAGDPWAGGSDEEYPGLNENPGWACNTSTSFEYVVHQDRSWWLIMTSPVAVMADAVADVEAMERFLTPYSEGEPEVHPNLFDSISRDIATARVPSPSVNDVKADILDVDPPRLSKYDTCYIDSEGKIVPLELADDDSDMAYHDGKKWKIYMRNSWYWGAGLHVLLSAGALLTAWARLRIPIKHVPVGVRIA